MTSRVDSLSLSGTATLALLAAVTLSTVGQAQPTGFHGSLAGFVDLPTDISAFRCEPMPPEHTRDNSRGVRNCRALSRLEDGAALTLAADSTGRVVALMLGWPRTSEPDAAVSRLNAALVTLERRLGMASICGNTDVPWHQSYHWQTPEWVASLSITRNTATDGPANVQFSSWIKNADEVVECMIGPVMRRRDQPPPPPFPTSPEADRARPPLAQHARTRRSVERS
jgi:hypothetical protein